MKRPLVAAALALAALSAVPSPARAAQASVLCKILWCSDAVRTKAPHHVRLARRARPRRARDEGQIVAHPDGCPKRNFCGCGAAVRLFGRPVRSLWPAVAWFRFPRVSPAPGMVAVRQHHVFVLLEHIQGDEWLAYDANSRGHLTRIHARSIRGFTIVNPKA